MKKKIWMISSFALGVLLTACHSTQSTSSTTVETTQSTTASTTEVTTTTQLPVEEDNTVYNYFTKGQKVVYRLKGNIENIDQVWDLDNGKITIYDGGGLTIKDIQGLSDKETIQRVRELNKKLDDETIQKKFDFAKEQEETWKNQNKKRFDVNLSNEYWSKYKGSYKPTQSNLAVVATTDANHTKIDKEYVMFVPNLKWNLPLRYSDNEIIENGYYEVGDLYYQLLHNTKKVFTDYRYFGADIVDYNDLKSDQLDITPDESSKGGYVQISPYQQPSANDFFRFNIPSGFTVIAQQEDGDSRLSTHYIVARSGTALKLDTPTTEGIYFDDDIEKAKENIKQQKDELLASRIIFSGEE